MFDKKSTTIDVQIGIIKFRGLVIDSRLEASQVLHLGALRTETQMLGAMDKMKTAYFEKLKKKILQKTFTGRVKEKKVKV
jgi:hypothetical protein